MDDAESALPFQWIVHSIGVVGVFYGLGFIIENAYQDLLGVTLENSPSVYLISAGNFFFDLVIFCLDALEAVFGSPGLAVVGVLALGALTITGPMLVNAIACVLQSRFRSVTVAVVAILAVSKIAFFDAPVIPLKNLLISELTFDHPFYLAGFPERRTTQVWHDVFCSRANDSPANSQRCDPNATNEDYGRKLRRRFLTDVLVTSVLAGAASLVLRTRGSGKDGGRTPGFDPTVAFIGVPVTVGLLLLPYLYGKTLRPTDFKYASLQVTAPSGNCRGSLQGHVLTEDSSAIQLFTVIGAQAEFSGLERVCEIPRKQIEQMLIINKRDVLKFHLGRIRDDT